MHCGEGVVQHGDALANERLLRMVFHRAPLGEDRTDVLRYCVGDALNHGMADVRGLGAQAPSHAKAADDGSKSLD